MRERYTFRCFPQAVELGKIARWVGLNHLLQQSLLRLAESREQRLKDPLMRKGAETANQDIKRAESRQFAALFDKRFNGNIDQISGIVHDQDHLAYGFQSDMTN